MRRSLDLREVGPEGPGDPLEFGRLEFRVVMGFGMYGSGLGA